MHWSPSVYWCDISTILQKKKKERKKERKKEKTPVWLLYSLQFTPLFCYFSVGGLAELTCLSLSSQPALQRIGLSHCTTSVIRFSQFSRLAFCNESK
jgi:hypothetical protein